MKIFPEEIEKIEVLGSLYGDTVNLIKTLGGLFLAVGRRKPNSEKTELVSANHPSIIKHILQKHFGSDFQPILAKSEDSELNSKTEEITHLLSKNTIDSGYSLYQVSTFDRNVYAVIKDSSKLVSSIYINNGKVEAESTERLPKDIIKAIVDSEIKE